MMVKSPPLRISAKSVLLVRAAMSAEESVFVSTGAAMIVQTSRAKVPNNAQRTLNLFANILGSVHNFTLLAMDGGIDGGWVDIRHSSRDRINCTLMCGL